MASTKNKKKSYFFDNFIASADCSCTMANALNLLFDKFNSALMPAKLKKLHSIEHEGDALRCKIIEALNKAFITPIEREDILNLSRNIDNVTDNIEDVAINIYTNNITRLRKDVAPFTELLIECCVTMKRMLEELPNFRKSRSLLNYIAKMNELEEKGDALFIDAIRSLHTSSTHPIEIIQWREIYKCFEKCLDSCETVANTVQWVMIRNT